MTSGSWPIPPLPNGSRKPGLVLRGLFLLLVTVAGLLVCAFIFSVGMVLSGCAAAKPACQVIDVANHACTLLTYTDENGQKRQVPVSAADINALGRATAAKAAASGSAAPASSGP